MILRRIITKIIGGANRIIIYNQNIKDLYFINNHINSHCKNLKISVFMNMLIFLMIFVGYILSCFKIFNVMIHIKNKNLIFDAFEAFFNKPNR